MCHLSESLLMQMVMQTHSLNFLPIYLPTCKYVCMCFIYFYCCTLIEIGFLELTNHFNCGALGAWCIAEW